LDYDNRVQALKVAGFVDPIKKAAKALRRSSGPMIILGIDGPAYPNGDCRDQLCVAVNKAGVIGVARKIFPTKGDEANWMLCFDSDFDERHRVVKLRGGRKAILGACYDMFGFAERGDIEQARSQYIQWLGTYENQICRGEQHFADALATNLDNFKQQLAGVTVGMAAIHQFKGSSTGFWQRHGHRRLLCRTEQWLDSRGSALSKVALEAKCFHFGRGWRPKKTSTARPKPQSTQLGAQRAFYF
jgi:hypothetical protein